MWPEEIGNINLPRDVHLGPSRTKDGYHSTTSPPPGWSAGFRCNDRHPTFVFCFLYSVLKFIPFVTTIFFHLFSFTSTHRCKWRNLREKTAFKKNGVKRHSQILKNTSIIISPFVTFSQNWWTEIHCLPKSLWNPMFIPGPVGKWAQGHHSF